MVVTREFRDVLQIGRGERAELYSRSPSRPSPLLGRSENFEINLRLDANGNPISTPSDDEISALADAIMESGAEAVGVGILHSAAYPHLERNIAATLLELTGIQSYASSALAAYPREYERWSLAALAAYLSPVLGEYLADLAGRCPAILALMASSGGLISSPQALENPALCVLSGPAGGALAAMSLGRERILALDMGGTSTDVTLLAGHLPRTREAEIDGLPLPLPTIDIHTIGAGGGSIVGVDIGGMLSLGPRSAGAMPGPACYGYGGPATLSDAALLSGRLVQSHFLGGGMKIDAALSAKAIEEVRPKGMTLDELLDGVNELACVHLTGALRRISVGRGIDPSARDARFMLVPFGGAGALYAVECARSMGLKEILHPNAAGVFSAIGLMQAPIALERERTILRIAAEAIEPIDIAERELKKDISDALSAWSATESPTYAATLECRYRGQTHTLEIALPSAKNPAAIKASFESAYRARYTYLHPDTEVEIVAMRIRGEIAPPSIEFPDIHTDIRDLESAKYGVTKMRIDHAWRGSPIFVRDKIPIETAIDGPALIVEDFATLYLPPDTSAHIDKKGHAIVEMK